MAEVYYVSPRCGHKTVFEYVQVDHLTDWKAFYEFNLGLILYCVICSGQDHKVDVFASIFIIQTHRLSTDAESISGWECSKELFDVTLLNVIQWKIHSQWWVVSSQSATEQNI